MTQYHISQSGKSAVCKAEPGNCPLGGQHFRTKDEADFYSQMQESAPVTVSPAAREALSGMMEFGMPVWSKGDGRTVRPDMRTSGVKFTVPEEVQYVELEEDESAAEPVAPEGWEYVTGFTQQYAYSGSIMHSSEQLSGGLADHILTNPGYYTSVIIESLPEDLDSNEEAAPVGWGVLRYKG